MTNGRAKQAIIAVSMLTTVGVVAATLLFWQGGESNERIGIFVAGLFAFLTPTIGILLVIAQGKENAQSITLAAHDARTAATTAEVAATKADIIAKETQALTTAVKGVDVSTETAVIVTPKAKM